MPATLITLKMESENQMENSIQASSHVNGAHLAKSRCCDHCGEICEKEVITWNDYIFCCHGCQTVFEILHQHELGDYYQIERTPGIKREAASYAKYEYLDDSEIIEQLISYTDGDLTHVQFYLPQIHCSSCIWLLEHLHKLNPGIHSSRVNFLRKEVLIRFSHQAVSLREIVELLDNIGYPPTLSLSNLDEKAQKHANKAFYIQLGVAGFCFGNIMLLSLPEYLAFDRLSLVEFQAFWGYLNIFLALPVLLVSSQAFFKGAWAGLKQRHLNIDVPIALGILVLFSRSLADILLAHGPGYMDSLSGLVFFLLVGRWFQHKTYDALSFDRDYKSYFPITSQLLTQKGETSVALPELEIGNIIRVRNMELIPADGVLLRSSANIDYSFVTGEAVPVHVLQGNRVYAGGRNSGSFIDIQLVKKVSQSYLTQLWNEGNSKAKASGTSELIDALAGRFTLIILIIAILAGAYWMWVAPANVIHVVTSVLIIACPCGLALSAPIIYGHLIRIMGKRQCFVKDPFVLEKMAHIDHIVLDKTGTLTLNQSQSVELDELHLTEENYEWVKAVAGESSHPISQALAHHLSSADDHLEVSGKLSPSSVQVSRVEEIPGAGVRAWVEGHQICIGTRAFCLAENIEMMDIKGEARNELPTSEDDVSSGTQSPTTPFSGAYVSVDGLLIGCYKVEATYRRGLASWRRKLARYTLSLLSGDKPGAYPVLKEALGEKVPMYFGQTPNAKQEYITELQAKGAHILMMGDGLNDAGALRKSEVGVAISEHRHQFSPACDIILASQYFDDFPKWMKLARIGHKLLYASIILSLLYNVIGLTFAVQGMLSPLVAAILMPLSSVSVVLFGTLSVYAARYFTLSKNN